MKLRFRPAMLLCGLVLVGLMAPISTSVAGAATQAPISLGIATSPPLDTALTNQYIAAAGAPPRIEMWFQGFDGPLYWSTAIRDVSSVGAVPMITWDPVSNGAAVPFTSIIAGQYDSYIRAQAQSVAAAHTMIYIRFAHEMNIQSAASPWGPGHDGNTPATFIGAWQHVVAIFRQQGATNARWVWAPNTDCGGQCPFAAYYPGDAWVDDVGLDGYNFGPVHHVPWMSLADIFGSSYRTLTSMTTKPVILTETASTEAGGNKAQWITQGFLHDIPTLFPRVTAVIWWQRVDQTDWRVNSSPAAAAAWRAVVASPLYGGAAGLPGAPTPAAPAVTGAGGGGTSSPLGIKPSLTLARLSPALKLTVSRASITGIAKRRPRLAYTVSTGQSTPTLKLVTLRLPPGLRFARGKVKSVTVTGATKRHLGFVAKLTHGALVITLRNAAAEVRIRIATPELAAGKRQVRRASRHRADRLMFKIGVVDTDQVATEVALRLRAA